MPTLQTIQVPHLGGTTAAYQQSPATPNPSNPTLVLLHSFMTTSSLFNPQLSNEALTANINLIAIDLLGHGQTKGKKEEQEGATSFNFTYWDSAIMVNQVMEKLGVEKYFALGTSQGGFVVVRMALLEPERILGLLPLGTSMDNESERSRTLGCWDVFPLGNALISAWSHPTTPSPSAFSLDPTFLSTLTTLGFGPDSDPSLRDFWTKETAANYSGDEGRKRARMACINLRDRDGLHGRVADVKCPVLWMQGDKDQVYSVANAEEEILLFTGAKGKEARVQVVEGGHHFLSASHPKEVEGGILEFVKKWKE